MSRKTDSSTHHVWTAKQLAFLAGSDLRGEQLYKAFRRRFGRHATDLTDQAIRARYHALRYAAR